jgi:Asp-tRNA(Asn)/Glu-tRNA(Gln) amidotransferase A subunit family amidase
VQADRFRRLVAREMARLFDKVDLLLVPSLRDEMLTISNQTGHPSLTLRAGSSRWARPAATGRPIRRSPADVSTPAARAARDHLIGRLFDEGLLGRVGIALERRVAVADERPSGSRTEGSRGGAGRRPTPPTIGTD